MDSRFHGNDTALDRFLERPNYESKTENVVDRLLLERGLRSKMAEAAVSS